jgi:hypothetical protein
MNRIDWAAVQEVGENIMEISLFGFDSAQAAQLLFALVCVLIGFIAGRESSRTA